MTPVRILHCHSTFSLGGKEARAVALMNSFGDRARHTIISSVRGALDARAAIDPGIAADFPRDHPSLTGKPGLARYREIARYMAAYDLVLTYNWGAMDAVLARRVAGGPPLVHHEDGFNADENARLKTERTLLRRIALPAAAALVVPSQTLEQIALKLWKQPLAKVHRVPNGIEVSRYTARPRAATIPGLKRRLGEVVIGTVAGLREVKNIPRLVRAALAIPNTRLVVVGEGPARQTIVATAEAMGARDRLILPGFLADPARYIGLFDIFALSSDSEQFPIALVEAMAAGLPVASTDVGDVRAMLPQAQHRFVTARDDFALAAALRQLVADADLRKSLGSANRTHAAENYEATHMLAAYARIYDRAMGNGSQRFAS